LPKIDLRPSLEAMRALVRIGIAGPSGQAPNLMLSFVALFT
jgi:hypothetical protein